MTLVLGGVEITAGMLVVSILATIINIILLWGILISFILCKMRKQTKIAFYETIVAISPIVICELVLIVFSFIMHQ
jgi:hypothetical protein